MACTRLFVASVNYKMITSPVHGQGKAAPSPVLRPAAVRKEGALTSIRILVVDDHELVRRHICTVLNTERDLNVCGARGRRP